MPLSVMMRQYLDVKQRYPDCIVFFRLGDFYEMFFEDAEEISRVLDLTLTGRDCGLEKRAPMCGVPYHSVDTYLAKLVKLGYKIAICEQLTEPQKGQKLVERGVVRVITAGTIMEENLLEEKRNNFLLFVLPSEEDFCLAYADLSTGDVFEEKCTRENLSNVLFRIQPAETVTNCKDFLSDKLFESTFSKPSFYENAQCETAVQFLTAYIESTQKRLCNHLRAPKYVETKQFLMIDQNARRNLELFETLRDKRKKGSLIWAIDETCTSMGGRLLKLYIDQPLMDETEINSRLEAVDALVKKMVARSSLQECLRQITDIERITGRLAFGTFTPRDAVSLKTSLNVLPQLSSLLEQFDTKKLTDFRKALPKLDHVVSLIDHAITENPPAIIREGGFIKQTFAKGFGDAAKTAEEIWQTMLKLEQKEREETGIKNLKISYNSVFGFFIEINKSLSHLVPLRYQRKQTVSNNERYITEELHLLENRLNEAKQSALSKELEIWNSIISELKTIIPSFQTTAKIIAEIDVLCGFASVAVKNNYVKPKISSKIQHIQIEDGRHPVVEKLSSGGFVPNNTYLNRTTDRMLLITGPNMAGKSTYMRQVALIVLLAHIGCFVPAKSAEICLTDGIFTRVGASDDLAGGQSTFMVEMKEVSEILAHATNRSLVILDEIGRGTSTFDGLSIAWAVVEHICETVGCKTLFSTHYHELSSLEGEIDGVKNYQVTVKQLGEDVVFLHKVMRGAMGKSFGISVAKLAGIPKTIIHRANQIAANLSEAEMQARKAGNSEITSEKGKHQLIVESLKTLDINKLSPMQAFEILSQVLGEVRNDG